MWLLWGTAHADLAPAASLPQGTGLAEGVAPWAPPVPTGWPRDPQGRPPCSARRVCEAAQQLWGDPPGAASCARGCGFPPGLSYLLRPRSPQPLTPTLSAAFVGRVLGGHGGSLQSPLPPPPCVLGSV